jgi:hypothetical protein
MTTISSNNWTETFTLAGIREREKERERRTQHVTPAEKQPESENVYFNDICGLKCRINPKDENTCIICEPWCTSCGYPPHICDEYYTRCTGTKLGRWFNEEQGSWIEEEEEEEEEERSNQHKFGLCPICKIGLDDKSEFTFNYDLGIILCDNCAANS